MKSLTILFPMMLFDNFFNNNENKNVDRNRYLNIDLNIEGKLRPHFCLNEIARENGNVVCSPFSASIPVAELALGAEGETYFELSNALGLTTKANIANFYKNSLMKLRNKDGIKLTIANNLYISNDVKVNAAYKNDLQSVFGTRIEQLNFKDPTNVAFSINNWVKRETNNKITDLIQPNEISVFTVVVLINAVYFKAEWVTPFSKAPPGAFYYQSRTIQVPMMKASSVQVGYHKSSKLGADIIGIPYKGGNTSFVIVFPHMRNGIDDLLKKLRLTHYLSVGIKSLRDTLIELHMPKFSFSHTMDLEHSFEKVGIKSIFKPRDCDLRGISNDRSIYISKAKQKVFIDVDEQGTEAAAATDLIGQAMSSLVTPPVIRIDHPFFYMVLADGEQLFCGVYRGS